MAFEALRAGDSLAVFSWNMAVGGGDLLSFLREEAGIVCRGAASRSSSRYSHVVVLLQEAFRRSADLPPMNDPGLAARGSEHEPHPQGDPDVVETAARCGLALVYVPSSRNGVDVPGETRHDKGNAILATLPLSDFVAVEHPFETERKVSLAATIPCPGGAWLRVVTAHVEVTSTLHRVILTGNQTRVRQVAGLIDVLERIAGAEQRRAPVLVGGDFNTWSGRESALKMLRRTFPESPPWDGQSTRGPFPTDHIFFKAAADADGTGELSARLVPGSYRRIQNRYSSDHHGRFVWMEFPDARAPADPLPSCDEEPGR
jgi:endonuclease/exonuclease/phosphatase family metal-dependent hydrolase